MPDDITPSDLRRKVLEARQLREKTVADELRDAAPDYDENEPSVVTIRAEGDAAEKLLARIRKDSPIPPSGPESIRVKASKLLEKRFGRTVAGIIMTILGLLFAALLNAVGE